MKYCPKCNWPTEDKDNYCYQDGSKLLPYSECECGKSLGPKDLFCPNCGKETATARGHKHIFNRKTNSLHPSIVHDITLGGCGWHGWLKNGIFYN